MADEWRNTYEDVVDFTDRKSCHMVQIKTPDLGSIHNIVESILYCKQHGMEAYQGGNRTETGPPPRPASTWPSLPARRAVARRRSPYGGRRGLHDRQNQRAMERSPPCSRRKGLDDGQDLHCPLPNGHPGSALLPGGPFLRGMEENPDLIAVDAGSTDPGPYYSACKSFTDRVGVKRDLRYMIGWAWAPANGSAIRVVAKIIPRIVISTRRHL